MSSSERLVRSSSGDGQLALTLTYDHSVFVIELYGELDIASAPELETVVERAEETEAREILIDLSGLEFMDSVGITAIVKAARRSKLRGDRVRFLRATGQVDRVLTLCRLNERLPFVD